jgi:demethylmenaquinone methyltransferase/2-methoxy-6-polyprenyl-1,4-benzoquinol methylase
MTNPRAPLPSAEHKADAVEAMFDRIAPRYDRLNRILTFRLDVGWRRATVVALGLRRGSRVLDVACGTGDFCDDLSTAGYTPIGVDFSAGMLTAARARNVTRVMRADALTLPVRDASVDAVTCGFALRNFVSLDEFFGQCARVVRPGGRVAFVDVAEPEHKLLRAGHRWYFRHAVPAIGGLLSDRAAYAYLPASTVYLPAPAVMCGMLRSHGFVDVQRTLLRLGAAQCLTGTRG